MVRQVMNDHCFKHLQTWEVLGDATFSFGCAYAMSMLFEIPIINLEKLILKPILGETCDPYNSVPDIILIYYQFDLDPTARDRR